MMICSGHGSLIRGRGKGAESMWQYEKKLQYPVKIKTPNPKLAKVIISQLGGANGKKL